MRVVECPVCEVSVLAPTGECPRCGMAVGGEVPPVETGGHTLRRTSRPTGPAEFQSLYSRLGGREVVDRAIDIFYDRLLADDTIRHFFDGADMDRIRSTQKVFLMWAFGGPATYDGPSLREIHRHLHLTDQHYDAMMGHLRGTLENLLVPGALVDEVLAITASAHDDVVEDAPSP